MDFRKIFDTIPEEFDRWRPRYCPELFADLAEYGQLGPGKEVLEVGPGTGQATEPVLRTGCSYTAIELGEHLTEFMKKRFREYGNFRIVNGDFETYDFGEQKFDMVYSAAAFQWIPQEIGYPKAWELLKEGGAFAMFLMRPDARPGGAGAADGADAANESREAGALAQPAGGAAAGAGAGGIFSGEERRRRAEQILARHEAVSRRIDRRGKT